MLLQRVALGQKGFRIAGCATLREDARYGFQDRGGAVLFGDVCVPFFLFSIFQSLQFLAVRHSLSCEYQNEGVLLRSKY